MVLLCDKRIKGKFKIGNQKSKLCDLKCASFHSIKVRAIKIDVVINLFRIPHDKVLIII